MPTIGESFSDQLDRLGIDTTNKYNPQSLKENCVFVTIAVLTGTNSDELADRLGMTQGYRSLRKVFCMVENICESRHGRLIFLRSSRNPNQPSIEEITQLVQEHGEIGIAYRREFRVGHCVVAKMRAGILQFLCYQRSQRGIDMTWEFGQAPSWSAFWFTERGFQCQGTGFLTPSWVR